MKAYVQAQNGQWLNDNCYTVWYGLTRMIIDRWLEMTGNQAVVNYFKNK